MIMSSRALWPWVVRALPACTGTQVMRRASDFCWALVNSEKMPIPSSAAWQVSVPPLFFLDAMSLSFPGRSRWVRVIGPMMAREETVCPDW